MAFSTLYKVLYFSHSSVPVTFLKKNVCKLLIQYYIQSAGLQAVDEIVPTLLHALEDDETSDTALDGLKQILRLATLSIGHVTNKK